MATRFTTMGVVGLLIALGGAYPQGNDMYKKNETKHMSSKQIGIRMVVGGSLQSNSPVLEKFKGFGPKGVKYITAAGTNPESDGVSIGQFFDSAGIDAEWIPVYSNNCAERTFDPTYTRMVEEADAIYMSGGQSGRLQSCLFGDYSQSGIDDGTVSPMLRALQSKLIIGGSSAGAMNQPKSEILITGHSAESYAAVRLGSVVMRNAGNAFLGSEELVDVHFSERGRQGRLVVLAMQTRQYWAFGVDENTAYSWNEQGEYEVVGENGVAIFEATTGDLTSQVSTMHFLTSGDTINLNTGVVTFAPDKVKCTSPVPPASSEQVFNPSVYRSVSLATAMYDAATEVVNSHGSPPVQVTFRRILGETESFCGVSGQSFKNLQISQFASSRQSNSHPNNTHATQPTYALNHIWETDQ